MDEQMEYPNLTPWKPGRSGNPHGRPVGSRTTFSAGFIKDLAEVWSSHGREHVMALNDISKPPKGPRIYRPERKRHRQWLLDMSPSRSGTSGAETSPSENSKSRSKLAGPSPFVEVPVPLGSHARNDASGAHVHPDNDFYIH
jgi:hypothetical protein